MHNSGVRSRFTYSFTFRLKVILLCHQPASECPDHSLQERLIFPERALRSMRFGKWLLLLAPFGDSQVVVLQSLSHVQLFAVPWTAA